MDEKVQNDLKYTAVKMAEVAAPEAADGADGADAAKAAERLITFVASASSEDRAQERVEIASFFLPTKSGALVRVAELGRSENADAEIDVPLLTDHNGWEVDKVIGSVRSAEFTDGKLIFVVGISGRKYAQDLMTLIDEGHLNNAFSIGWRGGTYTPDTKTYADGEILEVSLVTRGCNRDARVLDVKSVTEPPGAINPPNELARIASEDDRLRADFRATQTESGEAAKNGQLLTKQGVNPMNEQNQTPNTNQNADAAENPTNDTAKAAAAENGTNNETGAPEANTNADAPTKAINPTKGTIMNETTNHKQVAASQVQAPTQKLSATSNARSYLDTPEANHDFAKFIVENYGKSNAAVLKAWGEAMAEKGITGDEILPTVIEQTFFKVWTSERGILAHLKPAKLLQGSVYAFYANERGAGHKKGEKKGDVGFETVRRDYKAKIAFAKMPIDLQDLVDDTTGELTLLRSELLADLLYNEIARAVLVSDGRGEPSGSEKDLRMFDGVRGIWSMLGDINKSATSATDSATKFAKAVATKIANGASDNAYDKAVKTLSALKGKGEKILVAPEGFISGLMLEKDNDGRYVFAPGSNFSQLLTAQVYEFDFMADSGMDIIAFNSGAFLFPNGHDMLRSAFDTDYNQDVLLHEKPVAGSLFGRKVCAGYASAGASGASEASAE